ncbi:IMPACT family protein [Algoriphagus namhaensis]
MPDESLDPLDDSYLTLAGESYELFKDRNSKFLAHAFPVKNEEDIKERLAELRKKYYDARHHCYAYILGKDQELFRAVDDGEPNHSAGDPILGQIRSAVLTNVLIVVIRYFGGTKLGVSGLIHAYKTAAKMAIEANTVVQEYLMKSVEIKFDYPQLNDVMKLVKLHDLVISYQDMHLDCMMTLEFRAGLEAMLLDSLGQIEGLEIIQLTSNP